VAVTVTLLSVAGAKARQISAVPLWVFVRRTRTHGTPAPVTELTVAAPLAGPVATKASRSSFDIEVESGGEVIASPAEVEFCVAVASGATPALDAATNDRGYEMEFEARVAVMFAVVFDATADVATGKFVVVAPAWTVTDGGTITLVVSALSEIVVPPLGAAALRMTTHVEGAGGMTESGVHETEDRTGVGKLIVTEVPVPVVGIAEPPESVATMPESSTGDDESVVEDAIVRATLATIPFGIPVALAPQRVQVMNPAMGLQLIDFPADTAVAPATMLIEEMSLGT
jgi:hypothetical protein